MNTWETTGITVLSLYYLSGNVLSTRATNINKTRSSFIKDSRPVWRSLLTR